jgi:hypothetical protein
MANLLSDAKKQQVIALGQLGWTLRRIQAATGVRRETAGAYLKAAGLDVRPAGRWGHPPKPAIEVSTDSGVGSPFSVGRPPGPPTPSRAPAASACEAYRELIELAVGRGRNAIAIWRDLVYDHGFPAQYASVRRFVGRLRGPRTAEALVRLEPGTTKNNDGRAFPLIPELRALLERRQATTRRCERAQARIIAHVFHRYGRPIKSLRRAWKTACKQAGVPWLLLHDLRRSAVRNLERAGVRARWL